MNSVTIPRIKTKHVELIELLQKHSKDVFTFASHEQVAKTVTREAHQRVEDSHQYIEHVRSQISTCENSVFLCWAVKDPVTSKVIGLVSLTQLGEIRAQIGYVFHYGRWNTRVPVESIRSITHYAFNTFPSFERIQSRCYPENRASHDLLNEVGFHYEGLNRAMLKVKGRIQDLSCFSMTRRRWSILKYLPASKVDLANKLLSYSVDSQEEQASS